MTLIDDRQRTAAQSAPVAALASWPARAGALAIDVLPGICVLTTTALVCLTVPLRGTWWWVSVCLTTAAVLWTGVNRLLLPAVSGQSVGRRAFGIAVTLDDASPPGPATLLMRDAAHLLDTVPLCVGWLWPFKDARRRTFADILAHTESRVAGQHKAAKGRRAAATVILLGAAVCLCNAGISYFVVHQQDRADETSIAQIAAQGPRIVEQILSYHPETLQADFDRARSLTTDTYLGQLTQQQELVKKAGVVRNEYWVTDSSVLSATTDRATMLFFLQGQRGAAPDQRYLTASVRVTFAATGSGTWRVDDLAVVTKPLPVQVKP